MTYFALERESRAALAAAVTDTDVRIVLAGHHHLAQSGMLGTVPVAVAGSTAIRTDPLAPPGRERTTRSAGFNLVAVHPDTITVSVVPVDDADVVFDLSARECDAVIQAHRTVSDAAPDEAEARPPGLAPMASQGRASSELGQ